MKTAQTQINIDGPAAIQKKEDYSLIASYNLIAGKKAMECSDFASAFSYGASPSYSSPLSPSPPPLSPVTFQLEMLASKSLSLLRFFDHGISFLCKKHWQESYAL